MYDVQAVVSMEEEKQEALVMIFEFFGEAGRSSEGSSDKCSDSGVDSFDGAGESFADEVLPVREFFFEGLPVVRTEPVYGEFFELLHEFSHCFGIAFSWYSAGVGGS